MNLKNILFIFTISLACFFNISAQSETLFYAFYQGKAYFLLEWKERKINNSNIYNSELSWGASLVKINNNPNRRHINNNYYLRLIKTNFKTPKNNTHVWIKIEDLEKITHKSNEKTQEKNGLSKLKIDSLPIIKSNSKIKIKKNRQKIVCSRIIDILRTRNHFFANLFEDLRTEAKREYEKEKLDEGGWEWIDQQLLNLQLNNTEEPGKEDLWSSINRLMELKKIFEKEQKQ